MSEMTLPEFLLARIAEVELAARRGLEASGDDVGWHTVDCGTGIGYWAIFECRCRYGEGVLAECKAKRRLVAEYTAASKLRDEDAENPVFETAVTVLYPPLALFAAAHADHADYREGWKP